ncbi:DNA-binding response OmpR family regulator [Streptococcus moroccensis]|uniref:DNA-binding response OmpR family regulator n=2 Tax=Streptococcus moroccensis TaxID=1451356 RepID=A0ABT9YP75_9STRE|nr:DNA-binding response OmpR family regulator [Streptococcus moroccensis]
MKTIFVVEDDLSIVQSLKTYFKDRYQVIGVTNFRAVQQEITEAGADVVLMDITLPYFNGYYWTTELRKKSNIPLIFISSANEEMNAIMALNMGADDFIAKPFSLSVLEAKITALLRRSQDYATGDLVFEDYCLTLDGEFSRGLDKIILTPTENKILHSLLSKQGQLVTKEKLLEKLWENEDFIDQNTLNVNMTRLRKKLRQLDFDRIHTIRGVGFLVQ